MCLAVPGLIISVSGADLERQARVRFGEIERTVNLSCTPEAMIGDYVIVHVGCAISVLDAEQARRQLQELTAAGVFEADHEVS
jgi:hydrogenase expression/formation protein HypC